MPHNRYDNFNNFGQGQGGGQGFLPMGGGRGTEMMQAGGGGNPFTGLGGTFGLPGGIQGRGQLTPEEIAMMQAAQLQGGGELPNYNPALAGPTGVQPIDASGLGIDTVAADMAPGGIGGMDPTGVGAINQGVAGMQSGIGDAANFVMMQEMEKRRLAQLIAAGGGGMSGGNVGPWMQAAGGPLTTG